MIVIATGNIVDGMQFVGPIEELTDEIAEHFEGDWWVLELIPTETWTEHP